MKKRYWLAVAGVTVSIAVTTIMDAMGYALFSALPLIVLTGLLWWLQKLTPRELGLIPGDIISYSWALAHPALVLGMAAAIAWITGSVDTAGTDWNKTLINVGLMSSTGILMTMTTEEGIFRG